MNEEKENIFDRIEWSAIFTVAGIFLLFVGALIVTLWAPRFVDSTWTNPSSYYQVQMYEVADPDLYVSSTVTGGSVLQFVHHLKNQQTVLAFQESKTLRIISAPDLEHYVTRFEDDQLKLTCKLMMLREPVDGAIEMASSLKASLQKSAETGKIDYQILELYIPEEEESFSVARTDGVYESFVDENFVFIDPCQSKQHHKDPGFVYVLNPQEYRISPFWSLGKHGWKYDPEGEPISGLTELTGKKLGFRSRATLIAMGEHIFAIEGCWYCHTDQTRTLVQDVVVNGSADYPAPPSSSSEYIYQNVTFPGTQRNGPDLSRVAIKRPGRDWHKSHFWSPKTESAGSIMPSFRHFFDFDPTGIGKSDIGIPNYKFEAIYQYLMTKGSRITPPSQAWWKGKDPVRTIDIIEGKASNGG